MLFCFFNYLKCFNKNRLDQKKFREWKRMAEKSFHGWFVHCHFQWISKTEGPLQDIAQLDRAIVQGNQAHKLRIKEKFYISLNLKVVLTSQTWNCINSPPKAFT